MKENILYKNLTDKIIKCFYEVYKGLGNGFLESVYEKALAVEFNAIGLTHETQKSLNVCYKQ